MPQIPISHPRNQTNSDQLETMATLKTITAAIKLIDAKKEALKKAYDELQLHSSLLPPSLAFPWSDLDSYFTSLRNSLSDRLCLLEMLESATKPSQDLPISSNPANTVSANPQDPSSSLSRPAHKSVPNGSELVMVSSSGNSRHELRDPSGSSDPQGQDRVESVPARMELRALCEKMDGKGLRKYINEHSRERDAIRAELPDAMRCASDPGAMVLDALEGYYAESSNGRSDRDPELCGIRRGCVLLLEQLMEIRPVLSAHAKERAKCLAFEWKMNVKSIRENPLEALGFLHLVAAYGLGSEFTSDELVDYFVAVARYRQGTILCRAIGVGDKVSDLIQKLVDDGKQLLAIKFIFEFQMTDRFPPVPLLQDYLKDSKMAADKVCKEGKFSLQSQNEAIAKQLSALRAVIKVIEGHNLESQYPRESLEKHIEQLEKQKTDRKRSSTVSAPKFQQQKLRLHWKQQQQQPRKKLQGGTKRPRTSAHVDPAAVPMSTAAGTSAIPQFQQPHLQPAGLLPDHSAGYLSSQAGPYGLVGSAHPVAPYTNSSAGLYGLAGASMSFPGNPNPIGSHLHSSEAQVASGFYDRPTAYGGYGLSSQYHPVYYPQ